MHRLGVHTIGLQPRAAHFVLCYLQKPRRGEPFDVATEEDARPGQDAVDESGEAFNAKLLRLFQRITSA